MDYNFSRISGLALAGTVRLTGLSASAGGLMAVGEIVIRGLSKIANVSGISKLAKKIDSVIPDSIKPNVTVRPFKEKSLTDVVKSAVVLLTAGIALTEFVNFAEGPAPEIYNLVLGVLSPFRLDPTSWFKQWH